MSTLFYFDGGYMPDWIWKTALNYKTKKFKINILSGTFEPTEIQCYPIQHQLAYLRSDIADTLIRENFDQEYIKEAYFIVELPEQYLALRMISCQAVLHDGEGRKIIGKTYTERSFELHATSDRSVDQHKPSESIFSKIRSWLKN